jgi:hypothetical protein
VKVIRVIPRVHNRGSKKPKDPVLWSISPQFSKRVERSNNRSHRTASSFSGSLLKPSGSLRFSKQVGPAVVLGF